LTQGEEVFSADCGAFESNAADFLNKALKTFS